MARRSPLMNVMVSAVMKATKSLRRDFNELEKLQVAKKGPADFVTVADKRVEGELVRELKATRPSFGFILEEGGELNERAPEKFVIDPIDGTTNFLHGIPHFATSVAAVRDQEIIAGLIYSPITEELYWAEKGQGAYLNDSRIRVSSRRRMEESLFATGIPFLGREGHREFLSDAAEVMKISSGIRRMGAASLDLAYVAAGRFDGYWEEGLNSWDIAAGILLVREAGGYVTDIKGGSDMLKTGGVIAANDQLHAPLERVIKRARRNLKAAESS